MAFPEQYKIDTLKRDIVMNFNKILSVDNIKEYLLHEKDERYVHVGIAFWNKCKELTDIFWQQASKFDRVYYSNFFPINPQYYDIKTQYDFCPSCNRWIEKTKICILCSAITEWNVGMKGSIDLRDKHATIQLCEDIEQKVYINERTSKDWISKVDRYILAGQFLRLWLGTEETKVIVKGE